MTRIKFLIRMAIAFAVTATAIYACDEPETSAIVKVRSIELSHAEISLTVGKTATLTATIEPFNADNQRVEWTTDSATVATVSETGTVTAIAAGSATITATTADGGFTASCTVTVAPAPVKVYRSIGYIPNWNYGCYATLDYGALTHLNIAFCNPDTQGNLNAGINDAPLAAIIKKAHDNDVMVLASLGGAGYWESYTALTSASNREMFCDKIIEYAKKWGFDGIDLDVEGDAPDQFWGDNYEAWVASLWRRCDAEGLLLTTAVGQWYADKITTNTFNYFDFITIMEYHLKEYNYYNSIKYYLDRGIKAEDLVLGVPFFGTTSGNQSAAYSYFIGLYPDAWSYSEKDGNRWHSVRDIAAIAELSKSYGGIMIWELSQDIQGGQYSLLNAVKSVLFGTSSLPY